jgi:hypothetical protein
MTMHSLHRNLWAHVNSIDSPSTSITNLRTSDFYILQTKMNPERKDISGDATDHYVIKRGDKL